MSKHIIIDAGYGSFYVGSHLFTYEQFMRVRPYQEFTWLLDGNDNFRKKLFPEYKMNRSQNMTPKQVEIRKRVTKVRSLIEYKYPKSYIHPNLEGDDLIALMHYAFPETEFLTFAQDKDMNQIPNAQLFGVFEGQIKQYHKDDFKAAKIITPQLHGHDPIRLVLYQAFVGDPTDNIPRILPPRRYDILMDYYEMHNPFRAAYRDYGEPFLTNLYLVLLPYPELLETDYKKVLRALDLEFQEAINWVQYLGIPSEMQKTLDWLYEVSRYAPEPIEDDLLWLVHEASGESTAFNFIDAMLEYASE